MAIVLIADRRKSFALGSSTLCRISVFPSGKNQRALREQVDPESACRAFGRQVRLQMDVPDTVRGPQIFETFKTNKFQGFFESECFNKLFD